ncbi:MAG: hypothetical protein ACQESR_14120 [Planctomycetota bacterium]
MKLRLVGNAAKGLFLQLYYPVRKRRQDGAEGSWLLLALLPTAVSLLLGIFFWMIATGAGIAVLAVGTLYAMFMLYVSFFGPTAQKAKATLAAVGLKRRELQELMQQQQRFRQQQKLLQPSRRAPPLPPAGTTSRVPLPPLKPSKPSCRRCKYRAPREMCAHCDSEFFDRRIDLKNVCPKFELNPAHDYYWAALSAGAEMEDASWETVTRAWEEAIRGGLPEDEDVLARRFLASGYVQLALKRSPTKLDGDDPLILAAFAQLEHAVKLDTERGYGVFDDPVHRVILNRFDAWYTAYVNRTYKKTHSEDATIRYLEERLAIYGRLPGDPMILILEELGVLYYNRQRNKDKARACFERILRSRPIVMEDDEDMEDHVEDMKNRARMHLQEEIDT